MVRLVPGRRLPPYSYVPGKFPHPIREPQGHSYGAEPPAAGPPEAGQWRQCDPYVWGFELFNHGYYWEAHESWEAVWHAVGRRGSLADLLKGLIKLAAAGVKAREGRTAGVRRHAVRAGQLFQQVQQRQDTDQCLGLTLSEMIGHAGRLAANPEAVVDCADCPVVPVMPFVLQPRDG